MNVKLTLISDDNSIVTRLSKLAETNPKISLSVFNELPAQEVFFSEKFDVVILDKKSCPEWLKVYDTIKHAYINTIFVVIVESVTIDEIKSGFKKGIYEILKKDLDSDNFVQAVCNAIKTAFILKSNEKVHQYCEHNIYFNLPSDVELANETVMQIIETGKLTGFIKDNDIESNLRLAYTEAIINAIVHGNKSDKDKKVVIHAKVTNKLMQVAISDQGEGYNVKNIDNPLDGENLLKSSGRGIYIIKAIADEVLFEEHGSKIILINRKE